MLVSPIPPSLLPTSTSPAWPAPTKQLLLLLGGYRPKGRRRRTRHFRRGLLIAEEVVCRVLSCLGSDGRCLICLGWLSQSVVWFAPISNAGVVSALRDHGGNRGPGRCGGRSCCATPSQGTADPI